MLIQIETENLIKEKLTPNDYIILKLLFEQNYQLLKKLFFAIGQLEENLIVLEAEGYLKVTCDELDWTKISTQISIRQKTIDLFVVKKTGFYKWWSMYPIKVGAGNSLRVLKTGAVDSKQAIICKQKFDRITGKDPVVEDQVIKGLEIELSIRRKSNSMAFMQLVETWLNQNTWEKYIHLADEFIVDNVEKTEGI